MDDTKVILRALGEIRRLAVAQAASQPQRKNLFPRPHVYAVLHRIYPIFDESRGLLTEADEVLYALPFSESYDVGYEKVKEVADLLDSKWIGHEPITFYQLENPYRFGEKPWGGLNIRKELVSICRYLFLHGSFDNDFWTAFMSNTPQEAETITDPWSDDELIFVM
jgi:antitoxin MazE